MVANGGPTAAQWQPNSERGCQSWAAANPDGQNWHWPDDVNISDPILAGLFCAGWAGTRMDMK